MAYYKYTHSGFLNGILQNGTVRVGTIHSYRSDHNKEVEDVNEGKGTGFTRLEGTKQFTADQQPPGLVGALLNLKGTATATLSNITVTTNYDLPNAYIYCLTSTDKPDRQVMEAFDNDTCLKIINIDKFCQGIANALFEQRLVNSTRYIRKSCIYDDRLIGIENTITDPFNLYWVKEAKYVHQKEVRIIFPGAKTDITPITIDVPAIKTCFKVIDI